MKNPRKIFRRFFREINEMLQNFTKFILYIINTALTVLAYYRPKYGGINEETIFDS